VIAPDTSILVAGFDSTHPFTRQAVAALVEVRRDGRLVTHTIAETFAVLSAPGGPYPASPAIVVEYLSPLLERDPVGLSPRRYPRAVTELARLGVRGGAVYDGLIALAARDAGAELVSLDRRAAKTYERVGVQYRIIPA
jgi:predicted nucleic acid-binding protein